MLHTDLCLVLGYCNVHLIVLDTTVFVALQDKVGKKCVQITAPDDTKRPRLALDYLSTMLRSAVCKRTLIDDHRPLLVTLNRLLSRVMVSDLPCPVGVAVEVLMKDHPRSEVKVVLKMECFLVKGFLPLNCGQQSLHTETYLAGYMFVCRNDR